MAAWQPFLAGYRLLEEVEEEGDGADDEDGDGESV